MLTKRIIPCFDVAEGRVVKGVRFMDLRDAGDPVELAALYDAEGADELVFLDIKASPERRDTALEMVRRIADQVFIPFAVGGGIRTTEDVRLMLESGADKVAINTAAVENPEFVAEASEKFGAQCIVVAIDAKRRGGGRRQGAPHAGGFGGGSGAGNRLGRRRLAAAPVRRHRGGEGGRRACRLHLPLRDVPHPGGQGVPGAARRAGFAWNDATG